MEGFLANLDPLLIYVLVGLLTFGESATFLGLLLPGEIGLVAAAALAKSGNVSWAAIALVAAIGAALGGLVGYEVSRRYGDRLLQWGPISRHFGADMTRWSLRMSGNRGLGLVAIGRFNQVTRAVVPALAGINNMHRARFIVANLVGALAWAALFTGIGYFAADWWNSSSGPIHVVTGLVVMLAFGLWLLFNHRRRTQADFDQPSGLSSDQARDSSPADSGPEANQAVASEPAIC